MSSTDTLTALSKHAHPLRVYDLDVQRRFMQQLRQNRCGPGIDGVGSRWVVDPEATSQRGFLKL